MNTKSSYRCGAEDELGCGEEIHKDENGMDIQNGAEHDPVPLGSRLYRNIHNRIRKAKPLAKICEHCNKQVSLQAARKKNTCPRTENIDHYLWLCVSCHHKYDDLSKKYREATLGKQQPKKKNNTSGVPGVQWYAPRNKWRVYAYVDNKQIYGGYYKTKQEAIEARSILANKVYKPSYPHHRHGDWAGERENCPYQVCKDINPKPKNKKHGK